MNVNLMDILNGANDRGMRVGEYLRAHYTLDEIKDIQLRIRSEMNLSRKAVQSSSIKRWHEPVDLSPLSGFNVKRESRTLDVKVSREKMR